MQADQINQPEVLAEMQATFAAYEAALLRNDVAALNGYFWDSAQTVRYGIAEHSYGIAAIMHARQNMPLVHPDRRLRRTVITTFGSLAASTCTEFLAPDTSLLGRQTQNWIRLGEGWRIVAAHVSVIDPAKLP